MTDERGGKLSELHRKQETWPNRRDGTFQPARSIVTLKKKKKREKHNHLNMLDPRLTVWTSQRGPKQPTVGNGLICFHAKFEELPLGLRVKLQPSSLPQPVSLLVQSLEENDATLH